MRIATHLPQLFVPWNIDRYFIDRSMILEIIASERRAKVHNSLPGCAFGLVAITSTRAWIISVSHTTRLCNVIGFRRYNHVRGWDIGFPNCARTATVILNLHLFSLPLRLSFYLYLCFSLPASSRFLFFFSSYFFFLLFCFILWSRAAYTYRHERA